MRAGGPGRLPKAFQRRATLLTPMPPHFPIVRGQSGHGRATRRAWTFCWPGGRRPSHRVSPLEVGRWTAEGREGGWRTAAYRGVADLGLADAEPTRTDGHRRRMPICRARDHYFAPGLQRRLIRCAWACSAGASTWSSTSTVFPVPAPITLTGVWCARRRARRTPCRRPHRPGAHHRRARMW